MIKEKGEIPFGEADETNIPVDVWLTETENDETGAKDGTWTLRAANYMPRRGAVVGGSYEAVSDKREELVELIKQHVLPLYETAVKKLQTICEGGAQDHLYYWEMD